MFSVAVCMVALDMILRLVMIEQKTASKWLQQDDAHETERLLRRSNDGGSDHHQVSRNNVGGTTAEHGPVDEPNHDNGAPKSSKGEGSMSGVIRMMFSGSLLAVLGAALINAAIGASFDTARSVPFVYNLNAS